MEEAAKRSECEAMRFGDLSLSLFTTQDLARIKVFLLFRRCPATASDAQRQWHSRKEQRRGRKRSRAMGTRAKASRVSKSHPRFVI